MTWKVGALTLLLVLLLLWHLLLVLLQLLLVLVLVVWVVVCLVWWVVSRRVTVVFPVRMLLNVVYSYRYILVGARLKTHRSIYSVSMTTTRAVVGCLYSSSRSLFSSVFSVLLLTYVPMLPVQ